MKKTLMLCACAVMLGLFAACGGSKARNGATDGQPQDSVQLLGDGVYVINGHRFVDLGLPSATLWAEANVGASQSASPGERFAWGETSPKSRYEWSTYKFGSDSSLARYCDGDGLLRLTAADDAATVCWHSPCRMPSAAECRELLDTANCTWQWTSRMLDGDVVACGYEVKSRHNGNSIFLPAAGSRDGVSTDGVGDYGCYWAGERSPEFAANACAMAFNADEHSWNYCSRHSGGSVRAVAHAE